MKKLLTFTCALGLLTSGAHAWYNQNYTGVDGGDWNTASNWQYGVLPGSEYPASSGDFNSHGWIGDNKTVNVNANATMWYLHLGGVNLGSGSTTGTLNVNAGTLTLTAPFRGGRSGGDGFLNVASGATVTAPGWEAGGWGGGGGTTLTTQTGGTITVSGNAVLARNNQGTHILNNGALNISGQLNLGNNGTTGRLEINGGTVNTGSLIQEGGSTGHITHTAGAWTNSGTWFELAPRSGSNGTYTMTGGSLTQNGVNFVVGANGGNGTMDISNASTVNAGTTLYVGNGSTSTGILTITDTASLQTGDIRLGETTASGTMTQSGSSTVFANNVITGTSSTYNLEGGSLDVKFDQ